MTASKRLAVATSDRMVSFYDMQGSGSKMQKPLESRIENLLGVPKCMEYVECAGASTAKKGQDKTKPGYKAQIVERLLIGDDLGFIHMYNFEDTDWHICYYKDMS